MLAAVYAGRMAPLPDYHETEQYMQVAYCRTVTCEMWNTTMKACSLRTFYDHREKAVEVTKDQLVNMLDDEGGIGATNGRC